MNPLLIGAGMISFAGVVVPYDAMQPFWRYWLYYLNPFHYLFGGLMAPVVWNVQVECLPNELTSFRVPDGQTCGEYMADFLSSNAGYVDDPDATGSCNYCAYSTGAEYAQGFNINEEYYGWRDVSVNATCECVERVALTCLADWNHGTFLRLLLRTRVFDDEAEEQEDEERSFRVGFKRKTS